MFEMFHVLVLLSLLTSNIYNVAAVTLNSTLLTQLGYNNQSYDIGVYGQHITDIDPNAFKGYSSLKYLNLDSNELTNLDLGVFKDSINLQSIDLAANPLTQLTNTKKITFPFLQRFSLYSSSLASLDSNVVNAFPNITSVFIQDNIKLSPLKPHQLSSWKKLKILYITTKNQTSLTKEYFNGINSLETLSFSGSGIKTIEVHTLLALPNVTNVELSYNDITAFEYLQIPSKLNTLVLYENKMNYFKLSRTMGSIRNLNMAYNRFRSFKSMDFSFLANLTFLDLSENPHAYPNEIPSHLKHLVYLNSVGLRNLSIRNIDSNYFKKNTNLRNIDLSKNKITTIAYDAFSHLKGLNVLALHINQISVLDNRTFVGLNSLSYLYLDFNNLSQLDSSMFAGLSNLQQISLYGNPNLPKSNLQSLCPAIAKNCKVIF